MEFAEIVAAVEGLTLLGLALLWLKHERDERIMLRDIILEDKARYPATRVLPRIPDEERQSYLDVMER